MFLFLFHVSMFPLSSNLLSVILLLLVRSDAQNCNSKPQSDCTVLLILLCPYTDIHRHTVTTPCSLSTCCFESCPARQRLVGCSLNTGVNTGLLSTSNAVRITEGEGGGESWCSFEVLHLSSSLASFYPTYFPFSTSPLSPHHLKPPTSFPFFVFSVSSVFLLYLYLYLYLFLIWHLLPLSFCVLALHFGDG